ncbi:MAG: T9SS type A sorting domain-containing protein [Ignavibacteria bacterium]|nr:T9SS type A sorting domain-containing protein [Ignavibacteria bacterium]
MTQLVMSILKYKLNFFRIFLFMVLFTCRNLNSQVLIFNEFTPADTIDMGMCQPGDSIETEFNIINLSGKRLKIGGNDFTFLIGRAVDDPFNFDFLEFFGPREIPRIIDTNENYILKIKYKPFSPSLQFPEGKKIVRLRLGVFDPAKGDPPATFDELVEMREFILIARKSATELGVYEQILDFDSVWINPKDTLYRYLTIQNNTSRELTIDSIIFHRSFNAEIRMNIIPTPIKLPQYRSGEERLNCSFSYYPQNFGRDTAVVQFIYRPPRFPDSIKTASTIIRGVGVQQRINLLKVENAEIVENFIDLGSVPLDTFKKVKLFIQNNGNLPFGLLSQNILEFYTNSKSLGFEFFDTLNSERMLLPTRIDSFSVVFRPTQRDTFLARIVLYSDIVKRRIYGYPDSAKTVVFNLRGVGLAPKLSSDVTTINFNNIIINTAEGCPIIRDTLIRITNSGNYVLQVQKVSVEPPYPRTPFRIFDENFEIPPYSSRFLRVVFDSIAKEPGIYRANLILTSSFSKMKDTLIIPLSAVGVLPDSISISFPEEIFVKPGSSISLPILVQKDKITRAKEYIDTITFNNSILLFRSFRTSGTAAEKVEKTEIKQLENGRLALHLRTRFNESFVPRDTLLLLNFDSFVGNDVTSILEFTSPRFGDLICARVLLPKAHSGKVNLDSLCGIRRKLFDGSKIFFKLFDPAPNPAKNSLEITFGVAFETRTEISLYGSYGNLISNLVSQVLRPDIYHLKFDLSDLPQGVYFVRMQSGIFQEVKQFIKTD